MNFVNAQRPESSLWFTLQTPVNFTKHWQWHHDAGYRTLGAAVEPVQYYYRTGLRYNYDRPLNLAAGLAFYFTRTSFSNDNNEFGNEFRFWEEINHWHLFNEKLQGQFRVRIEQRFFAETSAKEKYTAFRFRIRPGLNQKLNNKWSLQLTDEYMQQVSHNKVYFDQNRLTFSGIYHFNMTTQLQTGYIWLMWQKDDQHILTITFTKNISLHGS